MKRILQIFGVFLLGCAQSSSSLDETTSALTSPTYVQGNAAVPQSPQSSVSVALLSPQVTADLLVVFAGWNDTKASVTSVTDTRGDVFVLAVGPTRQGTLISQSTYYAKNVSGGSNTVTVHFSKAASFADVRVLEYRGLDTSAPFDTAVGQAGFGALASTGNLTTHSANELLVAGDTVSTGSLTPGAGYTARIVTNPDDDIAEDMISGALGSYLATAPVDVPNNWVIQVAAFKPAASTGAGGSGVGGSGVGGSGIGGSGAGGSGVGGSGIGGSGNGGSTVDAGAGGSGTGGNVADAGVDSQDASPPPTACYPLHATERLLVDSCGKPFLVAGDSPQCLSANLSPASMDAYFNARATQGFNAAWVNLLCTSTTGGRANSSTFDGILPFTGTVSGGFYDLAKPNEVYFQRIDALVSAAAAHGVLVFLDPIEFSGFWPTVQATSDASAIAYGTFLGNRYKNQPNIVWMSGNDMTSFNQVFQFVEVAQGIHNAGALQPQTAELDWPALSSTLDDSNWIPANSPVTFNLSYTYNPTYALLLHDYDRTDHLPNIFIEGDYEGEALNNAPRLTNGHDVRAQAYWADLSGATGQFYGNHWEVFAMDDATWTSNISTDQGPAGIGHLQSLLSTRAWWTLVPDETHSFLTAGFGSCMPAAQAQGANAPREQDNGCAVASSTADGTLAVLYMPSARSVTVNLAGFSRSVAMSWYDPTTGVFTQVAGSPFVNTGSTVITPPSSTHLDGYKDWAVLFEVVSN